MLRFRVILAGIMAFTVPLAAAERYCGEPVALQGRAIYFTSWKYVRQGNFTWRVQVDPKASDAERQTVGSWLKGDGRRPAVFETVDMPRGIRLVAQPAKKVPFREGQLAAQVFAEGKYKAWYVVDPCADPEPFSVGDIGLFYSLDSRFDMRSHGRSRASRRWRSPTCTTCRKKKSRRSAPGCKPAARSTPAERPPSSRVPANASPTSCSRTCLGFP